VWHSQANKGGEGVGGKPAKEVTSCKLSLALLELENTSLEDDNVSANTPANTSNAQNIEIHNFGGLNPNANRLDAL
jgi:hypothetical protein